MGYADTEDNILCVANAYTKSFYMGEPFRGLPKNVIDELKIMTVMYTEDVGGILILRFGEDGELEYETRHEENDFYYDEIGSVLKIKQLQRERYELMEELENYYRIVFLGEGLEDID